MNGTQEVVKIEKPLIIVIFLSLNLLNYRKDNVDLDTYVLA